VSFGLIAESDTQCEHLHVIIDKSSRVHLRPAVVTFGKSNPILRQILEEKEEEEKKNPEQRC